MSLSKKFRGLVNEIKVLAQQEKETYTKWEFFQAAATCAEFNNLYNVLQEKLKTAKDSNSDLNRAIRERTLELSLLEQKQFSGMKEIVYHEWTIGANNILDRLMESKEEFEKEEKRFIKRKWTDPLVLTSIINCLCLGLILYIQLSR